jgi:hypothetical protein
VSRWPSPFQRRYVDGSSDRFQSTSNSWAENDVAEVNISVITLKVNWSRTFDVRPERAASATPQRLVADDTNTVQHYCDLAI